MSAEQTRKTQIIQYLTKYHRTLTSNCPILGQRNVVGYILAGKLKANQIPTSDSVYLFLNKIIVSL